VYEEKVYRAAFCERLPQLREAMRARGRDAELAGAVLAVLAGRPMLQVLASLGLPPHVLTGPGTPRGVEPGGMLHGVVRHASGEVYRCPGRWCGLERTREPGGPIPAGGRCWLRDEPLHVGEA
jgi:hypothetical protein